MPLVPEMQGNCAIHLQQLVYLPLGFTGQKIWDGAHCRVTDFPLLHPHVSVV